MTIDIDDLRRKAEAAHRVPGLMATGDFTADAAFIAAANPATVLALINRLTEALDERDRYKAALDKIAAYGAASLGGAHFDEPASAQTAREALGK